MVLQIFMEENFNNNKNINITHTCRVVDVIKRQDILIKIKHYTYSQTSVTERTQSN